MPLDPRRYIETFSTQRDWWLQVAAHARHDGRDTLENLGVEMAAIYDDGVRRLQAVEDRTELQLRDLFWRNRDRSTTDPAC